MEARVARQLGMEGRCQPMSLLRGYDALIGCRGQHLCVFFNRVDDRRPDEYGMVRFICSGRLLEFGDIQISLKQTPLVGQTRCVPR